MIGQRVAVVLLVLVCYLALGQGFILPILLKKLDMGYWPGFGFRYMPYQQQQQQQDYQQREIIQVFPQYPVSEGYKTGQ